MHENKQCTFAIQKDYQSSTGPENLEAFMLLKHVYKYTPSTLDEICKI